MCNFFLKLTEIHPYANSILNRLKGRGANTLTTFWETGLRKTDEVAGPKP
ncbi:hypothetical protein DBT_0697 [Dissulfuribacter thermophilus]|uniref:Uncharacterized protein n=1 Tax=Dissulfuribacter thermophilus TaxID=1156395 RepID=A0A1B9F782_9BACT|nr:hypothetical protein DBT_0697 [Dissulfuribacter thermophilus]